MATRRVASTRPLDVIKAVLVLARQDLVDDNVAVLIDVEKAHVNGSVKPKNASHFITLKEETGGGCAKLKRWLHSKRLAACLGKRTTAANFEEAGVVRGHPPTTLLSGATVSHSPAEEGAADDATDERAVLGRGANDDKDIPLLPSLVMEVWLVKVEARLQAPLASLGHFSPEVRR